MANYGNTRREFIKTLGLGAAALATSRAFGQQPAGTLCVDMQPQYELSPYLYMQFMEPLGTTDGSVAAAWDFAHDHWRPDVIEATRQLAPSLVRWGGCFISYYRWKEGVGPRDKRRLSLNTVWGGLDTNQVGTAEFVDFCRQVGADPLMCVNFESDGCRYWQRTPKGDVRLGNAQEAAEWVRYCNDPDCPERKTHGFPQPHNIRLWQIGNETSYQPGGFDCQTAARKTVEFAKAMRKADPSIELIGWGDSGWARGMMDFAGEHLQYIAFHHMFNPDEGRPDSPLRDIEYRKDPDLTWERLMGAAGYHDAHIRWMREQCGSHWLPLAMTECHFALPGRNRCEVLSTWAAGVADARMLNVHQRHGDRLKIATLADFCGTRWQVNAVMIPVPGGDAYLMPVALVMSLYRHHSGKQAIKVTKTPEGLDVVASRTGDRVYLHVVNTRRQDAVSARLGVDGMAIASGRVYQLAADPEFEVIETQPTAIQPVEKALPADRQWTFPAASVSAVELEVREAGAV